MTKRYIDTTKKSNIKCEHCRYRDKSTSSYEKDWCSLHEKEVNYWNRCKQFEWEIE